jgi:hypothetical protein
MDQHANIQHTKMRIVAIIAGMLEEPTSENKEPIVMSQRLPDDPGRKSE